MINQVVLVGRLTRDPELRKTQTGKSVVSFTLAANRRFSRENEADFINCVAWNQTADFLAQYIRKGSLLSVEGSIQSRSYEDATGKKVYVQEVLANQVQSLESRQQREEREQQVNPYQPAGNQQQGGYQQQNAGYQPSQSYQQDTSSYSLDEEPVLDIASDDLPF